MYRRYVSSLIAMALIFVAVPILTAEETEPPKTPTLEDADTVAKVQAYLNATQRKASTDLQEKSQGQSLTMDLYIPYLQTISEAGIASAERILTIANTDAEKMTGYQMLIQGLKQHDQFERMQYQEQLRKESEDLSPADMQAKTMQFESEAKKRLSALLDELEKDEAFRSIVNSERFTVFATSLNQIPATTLTQEKLDELKKEAKEWANTELPRNSIQNISRVFQQIADLAGGSRLSTFNIADKTIEEFIAFVNSDECRLSEAEKQAIVMPLEGAKKRAMGVELNLYGKTLENEDFDWKALRGKYVLVKFTATWCGPCRGEIPGMLTAYEKYKDKDFEIVSVYIWQREPDPVATIKEMVEEEKLPWMIVAEDLTEKAGQPKQGDFYAIQGVPTMLLIDKEGKIISTSARGAVLQKLLKELLGE